MKRKREFVECRFGIVVDDRESAPYRFQGMRDDRTRLPLAVPLHTQRLKTGDYTLVGQEHRLAIERKSLSDLFGTLSPKSEGGRRRERFVAELARMNEMEFAAVTVEATIPHIWHHPPPESDLSPKSVVRSIFSWKIKFPRVQWDFHESRLWSEMTVFRLLEKFYEYKVAPEGSTNGSGEQASRNSGSTGHP